MFEIDMNYIHLSEKNDDEDEITTSFSMSIVDTTTEYIRSITLSVSKTLYGGWWVREYDEKVLGIPLFTTTTTTTTLPAQWKQQQQQGRLWFESWKEE